MILTRRKTVREKGKYAEIKAETYTDEDCERIETMEDSIRKFNYIGDTQFLNGEVVGKREQDGRFLTDIQMTMINQRDTETRYPKLPSLASSASGIGVYPTVLIDLESKASEVCARHNELNTQRRSSR